ncbi:unnamed protein product [Rotaria magnacalcarata]|uniref:Disease resistance R13L4/SHOC-2-like LRR domain-containing protein n=2 Tax=Rotaria magnacalcarata TaxID=392030 RepID=A0A816LIJ9_9BILA|nr:unnamed protein product [Rotaria magnacalcarata]CAF1487229.1 unnamed protein product [Rotaria magnacalcarata]CAF1932445.1 unnamed protein product [Rotaria magnacalcarata]CAF2150698.1 unnamed protein product [Rotaria magnacalcarata]CAF3885504.1 unnamed protein product [Rotaria magnacalcarata]
MQSSTYNQYLPDEFNDNFFYNDDNDNKKLFLQSQSMINGQTEEEKVEYDSRGPINGIKTGLAGLEIKGKVRTLSPVLFHQTNTQYLIMSNNELKYLPAEIGNLINLVYLDLSHNRLKTLPSQIGDLIHLKRLYLESNFLKNLPYELGKLNIEDLGLNNNPLGDHMLSLFARPNGTREVMNYLREKWNFLCSFSKMSSYNKMPLSWDSNTETDPNKNNSNT